ncbi:MAG: anti-sigma factor antagonist [Solirubrobacteraceae bacterium]|jgi:anti-anti-sigma factor|nr:anti-sigma factor antagonist [Solirubrobacteraceae bacterium]
MSGGTPDEFTVRAQQVADAYVVVPSGELDLGTVDQLRAVLAARPPASARLVLDLRELTFFDTSGMRVVVETLEEAERAGVGLSLVRGSDAIQRLFALAGIEDRLPFVDDGVDARRAS